MAGLRDIWDTVRQAWERDNDEIARIERARYAQQGLPPVAVEGMSFYDFYTMHVAIHQDLIQKYRDYEEMDNYPELTSSLDNYADEATQPDFLRKSQLWVESDNDNLAADLNFLFHRQLKVQSFLWELVRYACKYGDAYERLFVNEHGVIDTQPLHTPWTRKVPDEYGQLMGFVVSPSGLAPMTPSQFRAMMLRGNGHHMHPLPQMSASSFNTIGFEPWEVANFKLSAKNRSSLYGDGIFDGARWAYKRLVMMEDAAVIHKLCLYKDSRVWTKNGDVPISDVNVGDAIYTFDHDARLKETHITYKKCNGTDWIYEVSSDTRRLYANATHPVLCAHLEDGQWKYSYVEVKDIEPGHHCFVTPFVEEGSYKLLPMAQRVVSAEQKPLVCLDADNYPSVMTTDLARFAGIYLMSASIMKKGIVSFDTDDESWSFVKAFLSGCGDISLAIYDDSKSIKSLFIHEYLFVNDIIAISERKNALLPHWFDSMAFEHRYAMLDAMVSVILNKHDGIFKTRAIAQARILKSKLMFFGFDCGNIVVSNGTAKLTVSGKRFGLHSPILKVKKSFEGEIWDIGVDAETHNFVADGVVVHNTRAPSRYAFYVDTGNLPPQQAWEEAKRVRNMYKRRRIINPSTGQLDTAFDPLSIDEDFFVPVNRQRGEAVRIDSIQGPDYQAVDDIDYFRKKLGRAIKIPMLGKDDDVQERPLSQEDIRFASSIMRVQQGIRHGFSHIADVHMLATNRNPDDFYYNILMTVPSAILELARIEILSAKADIMDRLKEEVSVRWLMVNLFGFSEEEAVNLMVLRQEELDMLSTAEIEREIRRDVLTTKAQNESLEQAEGRPVLNEVRNPKVARAARERRIAKKIKSGAWGVSERDYTRGRSDMNPEQVILEMRKSHSALFKKLDGVRDLLTNIQKNSAFKSAPRARFDFGDVKERKRRSG